MSYDDVEVCLSYDSGTKHRLLGEQADFGFTVRQYFVSDENVIIIIMTTTAHTRFPSDTTHRPIQDAKV